MVIKFIPLIILLILSVSLNAQSCYNNYATGSVLDMGYIEENVLTKRVVSYAHLSERDVSWSKRVWRTIDLRERMNHPLFYPEEPQSDRAALWDIIKCSVLQEQSLTIYELGDDFDDQFRFPVKPDNGNSNDPLFRKKLLSFFGEEQTFEVLDENDDPMFDPETGDVLLDTFLNEFTVRDIIRYEIKEDCFFDKQRSIMDTRIIGISPVIYYTDPETGDIMGLKNLFWLYFPECRYIFQNHKVYNSRNDAMSMSFDDLFWKRQFSSYITKESNVADRPINSYKDGIDALLEAEDIKKEIFIKEHDMWNY